MSQCSNVLTKWKIWRMLIIRICLSLNQERKKKFLNLKYPVLPLTLSHLFLKHTHQHTHTHTLTHLHIYPRLHTLKHTQSHTLMYPHIKWDKYEISQNEILCFFISHTKTDLGCFLNENFWSLRACKKAANELHKFPFPHLFLLSEFPSF